MLCLISTSLQAAPTSCGFGDQLQHQILAPLADELPGAAAVAVFNGNLALEQTWGKRIHGGTGPITTNTRFRLASVSKTIASTATALLVNEAPLSWETPVTTQLHELNFKRKDWGQQITIEHLLSQSTGLLPHAYTNLIEDNQSYDRILGKLNRVDFICKPGSCYGYQNVVFSLVGDLIEKSTGESYEDYVSQRLFEPLEMQNASMGLESFVRDDDYARPHVFRDGVWRPINTTPHYYRIAPAAGVNASIEDMSQWLKAQLGYMPEVLAPELLDELHAPRTPTSLRQAHYRYRKTLNNIHYALGWRVFDYGGYSGFVHHGGYVRGTRSEVIFNRELGLGLAFLANGENRSINELAFQFLDFYVKFSQGETACDPKPFPATLTAE